MKRNNELAFEDSLNDDWSHDLSAAEVPIGNKPLWYLGAAVFVAIFSVAFRVTYLAGADSAYWRARAEDNMAQRNETPAPRGTIYDREGNMLAESRAAFAAVLDARAFMSDESLRPETVRAARDVLGIAPEALAALVDQSAAEDFATPIVLRENLAPAELVNLKALALKTIKVESSFTRVYPRGAAFSSVVGYIGRVNQSDLRADVTLSHNDFIGKAGVEAFYDKTLRGSPGVTVRYRDARGNVLREERRSTPIIGASIRLTIDGGLQSYLASRLGGGLASLGRTVGLGLAVNPETGEVLSLVNFPGFDNNVFSGTTEKAIAEIRRLLTSPDKPLFNRAISGYYSPGSTIKPLVALAALKEGVIDPAHTIFSNGYLLVPNQYDTSTPSKYLDWRYQGSVDLSSAIAQSSDVYFYIVGGGSPPPSAPLLNDPSDYGIAGLGITRLHNWWETFGFGKPTGVDMPGEAEGFLPTPGWKEKRFGTPWLLGDTYNVSIGQGDLLVSPLQLLGYIAAMGNGGRVYRPFLNGASTPQIREDITALLPEIGEVQKGMRKAVTSPQGTAYLLHDLPMPACAKTGSAQVQNNEKENALFVGYAPCGNPKIALLILVENAREGSLNAVPIAKDVLNWYYWNKMRNLP